MFKKSLVIILSMFLYTSVSAQEKCIYVSSPLWGAVKKCYTETEDNSESWYSSNTAEDNRNERNNNDYKTLQKNWEEESKIWLRDDSYYENNVELEKKVYDPGWCVTSGDCVNWYKTVTIDKDEAIRLMKEKDSQRLEELKDENAIYNSNITRRNNINANNKKVVKENNTAVFNAKENQDYKSAIENINSINDINSNIDDNNSRINQIKTAAKITWGTLTNSQKEEIDKLEKDNKEWEDDKSNYTNSPEEQAALDEYNKAVSKQKKDNETIANWWTALTKEDIKKNTDEKAKESEKAAKESEKANKEAEKAAEKAKKEDEEAANPGLKRIEKWSTSTMEALLAQTSNENIVKTSDSKWWLTVLSSITVWFKNTLTSLVMLISIWAFLYVWIKLAFARWNPEEFKKAIMHMIYVIIGIFIVATSWAAVTLVAWLNF